MSVPRPITIVGGGLAGLALGIGLRGRSVPVTIFEAGGYPRHRVCGEFICGRGLEVLARFGLREKFARAGAIEARTACFYTARRAYRTKTLPRAALCLSRYAMDDLLAREFRELGGLLHERERVADLDYGPGIVRATGRRLDSRRKSNWIGLKVHARKPALEADLEMHFVPAGYVGLCQLGGGEVNVCGLFATEGPIPQLSERWPELLRGPAGSPLRARLGSAEFVADSFCAVTGLNLRPAWAMQIDEFCVGDALTMIPPVTGNGMSMAFESAEWATEPLVKYSRGDMEWSEAQKEAALRCDERFARRLLWAAFLQWALMRSGWRELTLSIADRVDGLWRLLFDRTR